jgi:hypothetical protein
MLLPLFLVAGSPAQGVHAVAATAQAASAVQLPYENVEQLLQIARNIHIESDWYAVDYGTAKDMSGASTATSIDLRFKCSGSSNVKSVSYQYDTATGKYLREQDGYEHKDSVTGEQIAFTNVVTLFTEVQAVPTGIANDPTMTTMKTKGNGVGYYFHGGKVINIKWVSDGENLILTDPNGEELQLATGNTYVGYLDISHLSGGAFWN